MPKCRESLDRRTARSLRRHGGLALLATVGTLLGCSSGSSPLDAPSSSSPATTRPPISEPTTASPESTAGVGTGEQAWSEIAAERHATNYLAALAQEAFEQAAAPIEGNGATIEGQTPEESVSQALQRLCAADACRGPYTVQADGPGLIDPTSGQATSTVTVTHIGSGEQGTLRLSTFEGQLMVTGLPPLVPSPDGPSLVESLFGASVPSRVVVARLDAFEIWEDGRPEWVTNWWADETVQVEGDILAGADKLASIRDPQTTYDGGCARLMSRGGEVLALDQCAQDSFRMYEVVSGGARPAPIAFETRADGEFVWFTERAGIAVLGTGDAEGNLTSLSNRAGVDLLGEDYASGVALSTDGALVAYVDHADPSAFSHFWSPVVVVRDTATGGEMGRWTVGGPIISLELAESWIVVAEADPAALTGGQPEQTALTAIDVRSGAVNQVESPTRLFLP